MVNTTTQQDTEVICEKFDPSSIPAHAGLDRFISNLVASMPADLAELS